MIEQAVAGDDAAWRAIVAEYAPRVHALLVSNCHDHDLAEEITQSSFCTVAAKLQNYVEQGKFESWIFRIAMNRLRDEMRRRKRQAKRPPQLSEQRCQTPLQLQLSVARRRR